MPNLTPYALVLAGGGCRTFWAMGVLEALGLPAPTEYAGVSAGATMALLRASGRTHTTRDHFYAVTERNPGNVHWRKFMRRGERPFPHEDIYRGALRHTLAEGGYEALQAGPPVRALLAYIEPGEPAVRRSVAAMRAYNKRKKAGDVYPPAGVPKGLGERTVTLQDARGPDELMDWIIASSATPPVTRIPRFDGRTWVDGGLVDNVPVRSLSPAASAGKVVVLLSRPYPGPLPDTPNRLHLAPSRPIPVKKWDYSSPDRLRATVALGEADALAVRARVQSFLAR
jgi:predicted acylesterase/phospholipase RssA